MATIISSKSQIYRGTEETTIKIVGYNGGYNTVARYSFVTNAAGASGIEWSLEHNYVGEGTMPALRWCITSDASSHINAGASTTAYHGSVSVKDAGGGDYTFSGSASIVLMPSTTYYLWIFPAVTTFGFYYLASAQTATLTTSGAAKSVLSVSGNQVLGTALNLTVTRYSTALSHAITYACGSETGTAVAATTATDLTWTPPISLASKNTTGTSVSITLTITTYSGSTVIGSSSVVISCAIPDSVKPSCSVAVTDASGLEDVYGNPVKGFSKLKVVISCTTAYGSDIAAYSTSVNGATYTEPEFTTGLLKSSGTLQIAVTVKDKRGRSGTASVSREVLDYSRPQITQLKAKRCDEDGTENGQGAYVLVTFSGSVTPLNNKNTALYLMEYKRTQDSSCTAETLLDYTNVYSVTGGTYIFEADTDSSYNVRLTIYDALDDWSVPTVASTAATIVHISASGLGLAVGKIAEKDYVFELAKEWLLSILGNAVIGGNLTVGGAALFSAEAKRMIFTQTDDVGEESVSVIKEYPTTAGIYRVGNIAGIAGMPADAGSWGTLFILNSGGYALHLYVDNNRNLYWTHTAESNGTTQDLCGLPTSWERATGTTVAAVES